MKPALGDIVEIVFLDHSEGARELTFRVFGRLSKKTRTIYVVDCWEPAEAGEDDADGFNRHQFSIVRRTIIETHLLRRCGK